MNNNCGRFCEFEEDSRLFDRQIDGIRYWQLIRNFLFMESCRIKNNLNDSHPDMENAYKRWWQGFFALFSNSIKYKTDYTQIQDSILFSLTQRIEKDGKAYDQICSPLLENIRVKTCILDRPVQFKHIYTEKPDNVIYADRFDLKRSILIRIRQWMPGIYKKKYLRELNYWYKDVSEILEVEIPKDIIINRMIHVLITDKVMSEIFRKILTGNRPKCIIANPHYDAFNFSLTKVAHELNIPVIEMQHGYLSDSHLAYNYQKEHMEYFPDKILMFGDYWKNVVLYENKDRIAVCGFPKLEEDVIQYQTSEADNTILVISQGPFAGSLRKFVVELQAYLIEAHLDHKYRIIYKLHPSEYKSWRKVYPEFMDLEIEVMDSKKTDLHYLMSKAVLQIGINSTALFEGFAFGLQTAILDIDGLSSDMKNICQRGYAVLIRNADEAVTLLNQCTENFQCGYFWKTNGLANIKNEIGKIIHEEL